MPSIDFSHTVTDRRLEPWSAPRWGAPKVARSVTQRVQLAVTLLIVLLPLAGLVVALALVDRVSAVDLGLLAAFYVITGLGLTAGYHRLFTHRSFTANLSLKVGLAVAGGMSFEGSWHNVHHADPTSARHGVDPHQVDLAAGFIGLCERLGWATRVQWPTPARIEARRC